jgi:hypothetical protein
MIDELKYFEDMTVNVSCAMSIVSVVEMGLFIYRQVLRN